MSDSGKPSRYPTQECVRGLFDYDASTGNLIWKQAPEDRFSTNGAFLSWNKKHIGRVAGTVKSDGYVRVLIGGRGFAAHRLVYIWNIGEIPAGLEMDHIDGNRRNNRLENLRLVTKSQNARNRRRRSNNTSGAVGISYMARNNAWGASCTISGNYHWLGSFKTKELAAEASRQFRKENGFTERHGRDV